MTGGIDTGGARGPKCPPPPPPPSPHFNFRTKQGPTVSFSNISDMAFYRYSEIIRTRNFTVFIVYAKIFGQFTAAFHFF